MNHKISILSKKQAGAELVQAQYIISLGLIITRPFFPFVTPLALKGDY